MLRTGVLAATLVCAVVAGEQKAIFNYIPGMELVQRQKGDQVPVMVNSIHSHEALVPYDFYSMPFCKPESSGAAEAEKLGQLLLGDKIEPSLYTLHMMEDEACKAVCADQELTRKDLALFKKRIQNGYRGNFVIDNLPVIGGSGYVGNTGEGSKCLDGAPRGWPIGVPKRCMKEGKPVINNHLDFIITVNEQTAGQFSIVQVNVKAQSIDYSAAAGAVCNAEFKPAGHPPLEILSTAKGGQTVKWTYGVQWVINNDIAWSQRWDAYLSQAVSNSSQSSHLHWTGIIQSLAIILLLGGIVAIILLRALHIDFNRYNSVESFEEQQEEMGWKMVHGDVFRAPAHAPLLGAIVATGSQLIGMLVVVLVFAMLGYLSPANRGGLITAGVLLFVMMAAVNGFVMGGLLKMFELRQWKYVFLSALLYPGMCFTIWITRELVILAANPLANTASFFTILQVMGLWLGLSMPLVLVGAACTFGLPALEPPCRSTKLARKIPPQKWFLSPIFLLLVPGSVPFVAMMMELRFIMFSIWQGLAYYVFGFLTVTCIAVSVTAVEMAIVGVYYSITNEDYHWWWKSIAIPGGAGIWVFGYSAVYYYEWLHLKTWLATFMYFESMLILSISIYVILATVGFFGSYAFVYTIYRNVKLD